LKFDYKLVNSGRQMEPNTIFHLVFTFN